MAGNNAFRFFGLACATAVALLAFLAPARADFFDDARRTFETDIPHFFQDDIPCAFGGQPTSHTKTSCTSKRSSDKDRDRPTAPAGDPHKAPNEPANSGR